MRIWTKFFLFFLPTCWCLESICPPAESIAPSCICKDLGDGPMMVCNNLLSPDELIAPIKATERYFIFSLSINNSSLMYIPSRLFENTHFRKIRFVRTQLMALSDTDVAFGGLGDTLEEIRVMGAQFFAQWEWPHLRKMRHLELLDVESVSLHSVDQEFPPLPSLVALGLTKAGISFMVKKAFSSLSALKILNLKKNQISELRRSMFPNPADHLFTLDLSDNELISLPDDMFKDMPSLIDVVLDNNKFTTLNEATFAWPLMNLQTLTLRGNELRCDCRMRWLVDVKKPIEFLAVCSLPQSLQGVPLSNLVTKVLWC